MTRVLVHFVCVSNHRFAARRIYRISRVLGELCPQMTVTSRELSFPALSMACDLSPPQEVPQTEPHYLFLVAFGRSGALAGN